MFIYLLTNIRNNKVYVGQTKSLDERMRRHTNETRRGNNNHLYSAMRKYGLSCFRIEVIEEVDQVEADEAECMWIEFYGSDNRDLGYNMTKGGGGGDTFTNHPRKEEIRKKFQARKWTDIQRERIVTSMTGRKREPFSDEWRKKLSDSVKKSGHVPPITSLPGELHPMWGKNHSDEAKSKISLARSGKTYEEIFGETAAADMKRAKSEKYSGSGNPFYKSIEMLSVLSRLADDPKTKIGDLAKEISVSRPTLGNRLRNIFGCDNMQRFRESMSQCEFQQLCKEKINAMEIA